MQAFIKVLRGKNSSLREGFPPDPTFTYMIAHSGAEGWASSSLPGHQGGLDSQLRRGTCGPA